MYFEDSEELYTINWVAVASFACSAVVSLMIWTGLFYAVQKIVR